MHEFTQEVEELAKAVMEYSLERLKSNPPLDGPRRDADGVHTRAAQAVDSGAGHLQRQACQQQRHARHVAVVFTGLVGAAEDHVGDGLPVHIGVTRHQRAQRYRAQSVGANGRESVAISAELGADGIANKVL